MAGTAALIVTSLASGGFALGGVALTNVLAARREQRAFRTETALDLPDSDRLVWDQDWLELNRHLQRQEAALQVAGIAPETVDAWHDVCILCWRDYQEDIEEAGGNLEFAGIRGEFEEVRRLLASSIRAQLLRVGKSAVRSKIEAETIQIAYRILDDETNRRWTFGLRRSVDTGRDDQLFVDPP